jgi:hypothetical protein
MCVVLFFRSPGLPGRKLEFAASFGAARALGLNYERKQGTGTGKVFLHGRFRCVSLLQGSRPWSSPIEF